VVFIIAFGGGARLANNRTEGVPLRAWLAPSEVGVAQADRPALNPRAGLRVGG
jgi:hypothetical protein